MPVSRKHGNWESLGSKVVKMQPFESLTYVLLSNVYAAFNGVKCLTPGKVRNVKKEPGWV